MTYMMDQRGLKFDFPILRILVSVVRAIGPTYLYQNFIFKIRLTHESRDEGWDQVLSGFVLDLYV